MRERSRPRPGGLPRFGDGRDWFFRSGSGCSCTGASTPSRPGTSSTQWRGRVPRTEYEKLRQQWNPTKYDPDAWLDLAQSAGMKYVCLTTKHHDGFCLWDTKQTDYNTMHTPYGQDVLRMLADACHRRDVPLCLYYSIADWHHPNYPNQGRHHELPPQPGDDPDWDKYLEFLRAQVRELCTNYGTIHGFWWDMNVPKHVDPSINAMIRQLQPDAVINNRGFDEGDFGTPERDYEKDAAVAFDRPTEACQSVGTESWGYPPGRGLLHRPPPDPLPRPLPGPRRQLSAERRSPRRRHHRPRSRRPSSCASAPGTAGPRGAGRRRAGLGADRQPRRPADPPREHPLRPRSTTRWPTR